MVTAEARNRDLQQILFDIRNHRFQPGEVRRLEDRRDQPLYLPWQVVCSALDEITGGRWQSEVLHSGVYPASYRERKADGFEKREWATAHVRLTIADSTGQCVSRSALASVLCDAGPPPLETAERSALKRAAMLFGLGDDLSQYEREVPRRGQQQRRAPERREHSRSSQEAPPAAAGNGHRENGAEHVQEEGDTRPCPQCSTGKVRRRRDGEFYDACWSCANGRQPRQESGGRIDGVPIDDTTGCIGCGNRKRSKGDYCDDCLQKRTADASEDVVTMIDRLPQGDPQAYTDFLRRIQASGNGKAERRYLWETARRGGLDFDVDTKEFVSTGT